MIEIGLVDDLRANRQVLKAFIDDAVTFAELGGTVKFSDEISLLDLEAIKESTRSQRYSTYIKRISSLPKKRECIVFVDLKLDSLSSVEANALREKYVSMFPETIHCPLPCIEGFVAAIELLRNTNLTPLMIVLATVMGEGRAPNKYHDVLTRIGESVGRKKDEFRVTVLGMELSRDDKVPARVAIVCTEWQKWRSRVWHPDAEVRNAIEMFATPWTARWRVGAGYWAHEEIEKQGANAYGELLSRWIWPGTSRKIDVGDAKCLCCCGKGLSGAAIPTKRNGRTAKSSSVSPPWEFWDEGFENSDLPSFGNVRDIRVSVLEAVLVRLGIEGAINAGVRRRERWRMPSVPLLPFLTAVRAFLANPSFEKRLVPALFDRYRGLSGSYYSIAFKLSSSSKMSHQPFSFADAFLQKADGEGVQSHFGGLSKDLHGVTFCRTPGLHASPEDAPQWLQYFMGTGVRRPCVSVLLGPREIHLIWSGKD